MKCDRKPANSSELLEQLYDYEKESFLLLSSSGLVQLAFIVLVPITTLFICSLTVCDISFDKIIRWLETFKLEVWIASGTKSHSNCKIGFQ